MELHKQIVLVADDSEINRAILKDILRDDFEVIEAENGKQVIDILMKQKEEISVILLDTYMPEQDGFEVLAVMHKYRWNEEIPVVMITPENAQTNIHRAYNLGAVEYIQRPFDALVVRRRVLNAVMLQAKQKKLEGLVHDQIYDNEKNNNLLVSILSHIVEFRNGENGLHILHINTLTELLLISLVTITDKYQLKQEDITMIIMASSLHDIGKIGISEEILNKPGKLTKEEFEIVKNHSRIGASMLDQLPYLRDELIVKYAYEICRWHHERYDGKGYPDGLVGEEIPIAAQITALADAYDGLTSKRVYKTSFSHEEALKMIFGGECGAFNPLLLAALENCADQIKDELAVSSVEDNTHKRIRRVTEEMLKKEELTASDRSLRLMENERSKYEAFAAMLKEIQFEYNRKSRMLKLFESGANRLGIHEYIANPGMSEELKEFIDNEALQEIIIELHNTVPEYPLVQIETTLRTKIGRRRHKIIARALWSDEKTPQYTGAIGIAIDIQEEHRHLQQLEKKISLDALTGLLNHATAKKRIKEKLAFNINGRYALIIFDLDFFKLANDTYGHGFGDEVLIYIAKELKRVLRRNDLAVRVGGDEFLIFLEYTDNIHTVVERIFKSLSGKYKEFPISLSMGISTTDDYGRTYDILFNNADKALYYAKRNGRGSFHFYNDDMENTFSVLSPIESR